MKRGTVKYSFGAAFLTTTLLFAGTASAEHETDHNAVDTAAAANADKEAGESHFMLLRMNCEPESESGLDTTPQSPPLEVDDPATPGCNTWEINILMSGDISKDDKTWQVPFFDINYGIGDNIQLKYEFPMQVVKSEESTLGGLGDSKAGIKYMFFEDEASKTQIAIYPQYQFSSPGERSTFKSDGHITTLPLLITTKLGETSLGDVQATFNIGYNISSIPDSKNYVSSAFGLGMPLTSKIAIMGEVATERAISRNDDGMREHQTNIDLGLLGAVNQHLMLYALLGKSVESSDETNHVYILAGIRVLAGGP